MTTVTTSAARRRSLRWLAASPLLTLALASRRARSAPAAPLRVVASFSILADWLRVVGGDAVEVTALVGPDGDVHGFEPRPIDLRRVAGAELVAVNGLGFEGWMDRLVAASGYRGPVVVAAAGAVDPGAKPGSAVDPHVWHDLAQVRRIVERLRDALSAARPAAAASFAERAAAYLHELTALDARTRERFAAIPAGRRRVLTTHDAFGWFGRAYGIEFVALRTRQAGSEASAGEVARLVTEIRQARVAALFVENIGDPRLIARVAREAGVAVGGTLYSDALSPPGSAADSFLKLFDANARTIAAALAPR